MQEREPQRLLRPLTEGLARRGVPCQHALFVPPDSSYSKLGPRAGPPDLSWQLSLQRLWDADYALRPSAAQVLAPSSPLWSGAGRASMVCLLCASISMQ
jgi:folylpolyglutamate synthase